MRTLLIDNHDSYTFNLFQALAEVTGGEPVVLDNDDPALAALDPAAFDGIVISPGPGRPRVARDLGHVAALLRRRDTPPVLGVCLGHQAIGHAVGARVVPAPRPRHGHLTTVTHDGDELFAGVPDGFVAVRYHSLCLAEPLPDLLAVTARSEDGVVMAVRQRDLPRHGVQFHPESFASEHGHRILANFRDLCRRHRGTLRTPARRPRPAPPVPRPAGWQLMVAEPPGPVEPEAAFPALFGAAPDAFWLDSSRTSDRSRFSFLGAPSGPLGEVLTYRVDAGAVEVRDRAGARTEPGGILDVLRHRLAARRVTDPGLPFDLTGGYVGFFGYEMRADCGLPGPHRADTPDAAWMFADRLLAVDHHENRHYLLAVHDGTAATRRSAADWLRRAAATLAGRPAPPPLPPFSPPPGPVGDLDRDERRYAADITECLRNLMAGESYELNLTNTVRVPFHGDDLAFYRRLRRLNPAPQAAFLRVGGVRVFCSSPESFLRIEPDGTVRSRPIKGTGPRDADPARDAELAAELAASPKNRAENLMIVDLLRNDLGRVCRIGSVTVERFAAVESYATLHTLVSTVAGRLRPEVDAVECVRRCFPGGSMTGAPKARSLEILDRLETGPRGVYSGSLGYLGLTGGADLNIVIRTAVRVGDELRVGAGGAIVLDSDPAAEVDEMLLKAASALRAWTPPTGVPHVTASAGPRIS